MMLSLPPLVMWPVAPAGACSSASPIATTSDSKVLRLGKARPAPSAFSLKNLKNASRPARNASSDPLKT